MSDSMSLVEKFQGIVDGYYAGSDAYKDVIDALTFMDEMKEAVVYDSLASDGLEMIQSVMRDMEREKEVQELGEQVQSDETRDGETETREDS